MKIFKFENPATCQKRALLQFNRASKRKKNVCGERKIRLPYYKYGRKERLSLKLLQFLFVKKWTRKEEESLFIWKKITSTKWSYIFKTRMYSTRTKNDIYIFSASSTHTIGTLLAQTPPSSQFLIKISIFMFFYSLKVTEVVVSKIFNNFCVFRSEWMNIWTWLQTCGKNDFQFSQQMDRFCDYVKWFYDSLTTLSHFSDYIYMWCMSLDNFIMETLRLRPIFQTQRQAVRDTVIGPDIKIKAGVEI